MPVYLNEKKWIGPSYLRVGLMDAFEAAYKVNLDKFPLPVSEHINGIDKPVRDRMKGLVHGIREFIAEDTLRNFSHCFSIRIDNGAILTVCTLNFNNTPVTENFFAALINHHDRFNAEKSISIQELKNILKKTTADGVCQEDVMNHFWELDNKPVEDTLFWEATGVDLSKLK